MQTPLMEKLQMQAPIIQAPMAGVSTPALAAAVSNAGGLGSISVGAMDVTAARQAIEATRQLTDRPFNVNVFCHEHKPLNEAVNADWLALLKPLFTELGAEPPSGLSEIYESFNQNRPMLDLLLEMRPAVVSFHFGLPPQPVVDALKQAGIVLLASATTLDEARQCEQAGVEAIVAQGMEAGGHRGVFFPEKTDEGLTTPVLVRQLVKELNIPIIAAGGMMDGAGIQAALSLGAQAVQMGTAFVACPESAADVGYREALSAYPTPQTLLTSAISGRAARGFPNRLTEWVSDKTISVPDYPYAYDAAKRLQDAAKKAGIPGFSTRWAGQGASLSRAMPAAQLVQVLMSEMRQHAEALSS